MDWFRGFASLDRSNRCGAAVAGGCCWLLGPLLLAMRGSGIDQFCAPSSIIPWRRRCANSRSKRDYSFGFVFFLVCGSCLQFLLSFLFRCSCSCSRLLSTLFEPGCCYCPLPPQPHPSHPPSIQNTRPINQPNQTNPADKHHRKVREKREPSSVAILKSSPACPLSISLRPSISSLVVVAVRGFGVNDCMRRLGAWMVHANPGPAANTSPVPMKN